MAAPLTGAERQARYRRRHPDRIRAYKESDAGKATQSRANKKYYRTPHGRAAHLAKEARRVFVGRYYVGAAPTAEHAQTLNQQARDHFAQKETR